MRVGNGDGSWEAAVSWDMSPLSTVFAQDHRSIGLVCVCVYVCDCVIAIACVCAIVCVCVCALTHTGHVGAVHVSV